MTRKLESLFQSLCRDLGGGEIPKNLPADVEL